MSTEFVGKLNFRCFSENTLILSKIKNITGINLPLNAGEVYGNNEFRIQWLGPNEWIIQCANDEKLNLMNIYKSEIGEHPFPRSMRNIEALSVFRWASVGVEYAEAFQVLKWIDK